MQMDNKQKLEYIVRHYLNLMYSTANSILKDHYDAEDACQETFLKLSRVMDTIEDVTTVSARSYCVTTVRNTACDMVRKNNRQVPVGQILENSSESACYDAYPSDTDSIVKEINELPEIYRETVCMRCLEEKKASQIAKELHTNVSTVNSRLSRARIMLRKKWEDMIPAPCGA